MIQSSRPAPENVWGIRVAEVDLRTVHIERSRWTNGGDFLGVPTTT